ncbi:MAG: hypothetical protein JWN60_1363 [Acidobacteria bacterium]|jgi:hypothetical protein|nr:hypothetical protein [Acidobacteriota bacterium]
MSAVDILSENNHFAVRGKPFVNETPSNPLFHAEITKGGARIIYELYDEWTALCEEGASDEPFFRPEWFASFVKNFETEILLLTVRRKGKLRSVLPLVKKSGSLHGFPARKLQAVFNPNSPRFDVIHGADETEKKEIIKALWSEIKTLSNWGALEFRLVKKDSWLNDLLVLAEAENYKTGVWKMDGAPFIELPRGENKEKLIEEYFKGARKHLRQELNRRLRRLKERGEIEFLATRDYAPELMRQYFELEEKGWKGRGGTAAANDGKAVALHDDFARQLAEKNRLRIYRLNLDGKTIAMNINIMTKNRAVHWKTSYDEEYARYSPGNLLFREFLSDCVRNNFTEIDFLSPATPNKKFWATGEREHAAFYVFQPGLLGLMHWKWKFSVIKRLRKYKAGIAF